MRNLNWQLIAFSSFVILAIAVVIRLEDTRSDVGDVSDTNAELICTAGGFVGPPVERKGEDPAAYAKRLRAYNAFRVLLSEQTNCESTVRGLSAQIASTGAAKGVGADGDNSPPGQQSPSSDGDQAPSSSTPSPSQPNTERPAVDVTVPAPVGVCVGPLAGVNCP